MINTKHQFVSLLPNLQLLESLEAHLSAFDPPPSPKQVPPTICHLPSAVLTYANPIPIKNWVIKKSSTRISTEVTTTA